MTYTHDCVCHGPEERSARFAELDALIAAGYGNTPHEEIERLIAAHGKLPLKPTARYRDQMRRPACGTATETVLLAVSLGYATSREISEGTGLRVALVSALLTKLCRRGWIVCIGRSEPEGYRGGTLLRNYRIAEVGK